jgi:hypothetical protein
MDEYESLSHTTWERKYQVTFIQRNSEGCSKVDERCRIAVAASSNTGAS